MSASFSVQIHQQVIPNLLGGDYIVLVHKQMAPGVTHTIASTSGITSAARAEQIAADYRTWYGVQS